MLHPSNTAISDRLALIKDGNDPCLLAQLPSGYAVLNTNQPAPIVGCCMLIPDPIVSSLNELEHTDGAQFFSDLVLIGDAILDATGAERINYLVLCNQAPELHGHCIPRFSDEDPTLRLKGPFEAYDFPNSRATNTQGEDAQLFELLRSSLASRLIERSTK
jgi:diadenosine tetraphosphate (Ap4A) HIT family hydrolase